MFQTDFLVIVLNTHSSFFGGGKNEALFLKCMTLQSQICEHL